MKKIILILLICLTSESIYSQINTNDISFELRYPITTGNNYLNKTLYGGYTGLIDVGLDFNLVYLKNIGFGILLNSSTLRFPETNLTLNILSPKIKIEYSVSISKIKLIPQVGIGYSYWTSKAPNYTKTDRGLSFKAGTKLVINNSKRIKWYFLIVYEYTKLNNSEHKNTDRDNSFNTNIQLIYPGIGINWTFNKKGEKSPPPHLAK